MSEKKQYEKATFGAGCFWGVESSFRSLKGIIDTKVGYTGGHTINPTYEDVCSDHTGHAEAIEIIFNPHEITYEELVHFFFRMHDPTTKNRQGPDVGTQYRSVIFYHTPEQKIIADQVKAEVERKKWYRKPIVTEIVPAKPFYSAEEYHQQYYEKRGIEPSCHVFLELPNESK